LSDVKRLPYNIGRLRLIAIVEIAFLSVTAIGALIDTVLIVWSGLIVSSFAPRHIGQIFGSVDPLIAALVVYAAVAVSMIIVLLFGVVRLVRGHGGRYLLAAPQVVLLATWLLSVLMGIPADLEGWLILAVLTAFPAVALALLWTPSVRSHARGAQRPVAAT